VRTAGRASIGLVEAAQPSTAATAAKITQHQNRVTILDAFAG
jgi:hypothetical protein